MSVGIAFRKKNGQQIEVKGRYKIFSTSDSNSNDRFKAVFSDIPEKYLAVTERIIFLLEKEYNKKRDAIVYVSLAEHIHGAVERSKKGIEVKNPLIMDIRRLFKDGFETGVAALKEIESEFDVSFSEDEAAYIAQYLVNGQLDYLVDMNEVSKLMQEVINIIKYTFRIDFNEESICYHRFVTHMKLLSVLPNFVQIWRKEQQHLQYLLNQKTKI